MVDRLYGKNSAEVQQPRVNGTVAVSVIIPVHNKAPHIWRSISSVLNQTFDDFELIVIDDASTDGSSEEIRKLQDRRIRLFRRDTPGPGGYAARNLGMREAKGKWIAFLDADDEWLPEHLQKMMELAERFPDCEFLSCGWNYAHAGGRTIADEFSERNRGGGPREISCKEYLELCIKNMRPVNTDVACLRNNHIARDVFPEGRAARGGDLHAWLVYLAHAKKLAWSPHIGAVYHLDSVNMVTETAPVTLGFPRAIVDDLRSLLGKEEMVSLRRYSNRRMCGTWQYCIVSWGPFQLARHVFWRHDVVFCGVHVALAMIPAFFYRGLRRIYVRTKGIGGRPRS